MGKLTILALLCLPCAAQYFPPEGGAAFPQLVYWAHPASDIVCAHANDLSLTFNYSATVCDNTAVDGVTNLVFFNSQYSIPANFLTQDKMLRIRATFALWSTATAPNELGALNLGSLTLYTSNPATNASLTNHGFTLDCLITVHGALGTSATTDADCNEPWPGGTYASTSNASLPQSIATTSTQTLKLGLRWAASGIASGTYTSGITAVGTIGQTCLLSTFNNGNTGGAAIVALTGTNAIAGGTALTITNTGYGSTSGATSAAAASGSATCSGTATVATVLGGAQGNALQLKSIAIEELN